MNIEDQLWTDNCSITLHSMIGFHIFLNINIRRDWSLERSFYFSFS